LALVWSLNSDQPLPADPCAVDALEPLRCSTAAAETWDDLLALDRPVLLDMVTAQRFAASAVLLGVEGRRAWVATGQGPEQLALAELAPAWRGSYRYFWHPPAGFTRPLALGDSSPVVAEVAALFARLDRQPVALAETLFNEALQTRVRLFQRNHGLQADGVVGERTLLKLNELLGIDTTAGSARSQLMADSEALVTR
jgi:general secretion pathway protein A